MSSTDDLPVYAEAPAAAGRTSPTTTASHLPTAPPVGPLTRDFLAWVARKPRAYAETMEAWRTSCPRFPIWEDALADGLVRLDSDNGTPLSQTAVVLTPRGRAALDGV